MLNPFGALCGISSRPWRPKSVCFASDLPKTLTAKFAEKTNQFTTLSSLAYTLRIAFGVKCLHDSPGSSRNSGLPGLQKAAGPERKWREPEVRRMQAGLSGARRHPDSAGGRGNDGRVRMSLVVGRWPNRKTQQRLADSGTCET